MSTINSITTSVVSAFQGVTPVNESTPVATTTNTAPAFQETLTTQGRAFALGLGAPRNHGDIEALFAEIATKFGAEVAKANDFANAAQTAGRSTALAAAAGSLGFFASFGVIMAKAELNITRQNETIGNKTTEINGLEAEKAPLVAQRTALSNEYSANVGVYASNISQINTLNGQLASLEPARATACGTGGNAETCQTLTTQVNGIRSQISSLEAQNVNLVNRNNEISGQIQTLDAQIGVLQGKIDSATSERNAATSSRNQSQVDYNTALASLNVFSVVMIPFAVALALGQAGAGARASFDLNPDQSVVDKAIAQAVNRLADLSAEMGTLNMIREALAQIMPSAPDTIAQPKNEQPVESEPTASGEPGAVAAKLLEVTATATSDEPRIDIIPGTVAPPPLPTEPSLDVGAPGPQVTALDPAQRQSAMEMLRQLLSNLPLPTEDVLRDPVPETDQPTSPEGIPAKPQNAFDVVRQLLQDILPPAVGNAEEVAARAGELATTFAMLRTVLGQFADSEGAQTPQVPGASGRLNLAI